MRKYKTTGNTTLFDAEEKECKLTEMGDPPDGGAEGDEQGEVADAKPRGATAVIGLINLTYNMSRYEQIVRLNLLKK